MNEEGRDLKNEGIDEINSNPAMAPWRAVARQAIIRLALSGREFTSEDVTDIVGQPGHPNAVGAVLNGAARAGLIYRVGFKGADRPNQHAALISVWRGIRIKAEAEQKKAETNEEVVVNTVSPIREGEERPPVWRCAKCDRESTSFLVKTIDERYMIGSCKVHGKNVVFTRRT